MRNDVANSAQDFTRTTDGARGQFRFAGGLEVFEGHFPGAPLVPGIYLIDCARLLTERFLEEPVALRHIDSARFTAEVRPDDLLEGLIAVSEEDGTIRCEARFTVSGDAAAHMKLRLERASTCSA